MRPFTREPTMTAQDINAILSEIRSAREAGDETRLTLRFMQLPAELRTITEA